MPCSTPLHGSSLVLKTQSQNARAGAAAAPGKPAALQNGTDPLWTLPRPAGKGTPSLQANYRSGLLSHADTSRETGLHTSQILADHRRQQQAESLPTWEFTRSCLCCFLKSEFLLDSQHFSSRTERLAAMNARAPPSARQKNC